MPLLSVLTVDIMRDKMRKFVYVYLGEITMIVKARFKRREGGY